MHIENTRMISRPIEEVFAFLCVPENNERWMAVVTNTTRTGTGAVGLGDTFTHGVKLLGRTFDITFEVIEFESPTRSCVRNVSGPIEVHSCYTFEPVGNQTRLTHTLEGDPGRFFSLAQSVVERVVGRQYAADLETLNDVLEAMAVDQHSESVVAEI